MVDHVRKYKLKYGNCKVPCAYRTSDSVNLGFWVSSVRSVVRSEYRGTRKLSLEKIAQLDALDFVYMW